MRSAFIFPGQGSQSLGMMASFSESSLVLDTFAQASDVLGFDLWDLCQNGPENTLNATQHTQPALLAASVAVFRLWQDKVDVQPDFLAGHSLGEYSALVCAGAIAFKDAIQLVAKRGRYMQEAVPEGAGAMAAIIGLDNALVIELCETAAQGAVVSAANFNSPGQVVIAGEAQAVQRAMQLANEAGARMAKQIPVSVPSHCALMQSAADKLAEDLKQINITSPSIPVIHNVDAAAHSETDEIQSSLVAQLYSPVRWVECIQALLEQGVTQFVECGPGKVLSGLNKRIDRSIQSYTLQDADGFQSAKEGLTS